MSLTKILSEKDADAEDQLSRVTDVVAKARDAYGNGDAEIEAPSVDTTEGRMSFVHLEAAGQVAILRKQVSLIKAQAVEFVDQNPGSSMNKKIEELLAINPYFANVGNSTTFDYI
jgi:hypothetical protein